MKEQNLLLENKIALVTGSSLGIGAATAKLFARHGAAVAVNYYHSEEAALEVVREIESFGGKAIAVYANVKVYDEVAEMVSTIESQLGKIDVLVVNASMHFKMVTFSEMTWDDFSQKFLGELQAAWNCCKLVVPSMIDRKAGNIVMVSSGLSRHPGTGFIAHSSAKAGLNLFAKSLAFELSPFGIRVNVVAPGATLTDALRWAPPERLEAMAKTNLMQRIGQPEDMANAAMFFASELSGFITGGYIPVDGGRTML